MNGCSCPAEMQWQRRWQRQGWCSSSDRSRGRSLPLQRRSSNSHCQWTWLRDCQKERLRQWRAC